MALSEDRILKRLASENGPGFPGSLASGVIIYRGAIVGAASDGTLAPAGTSTVTLTRIAGISPRHMDNSGNTSIVGPSVGSGPIVPEHGYFALPFDSAPTEASINAAVYAVDDETVSLTESTTDGTTTVTRLQVGTLAGFDGTGTPYVKI